MEQVIQNKDDFVWSHVPSNSDLGKRRLGALQHFLTDFPKGKAEGRYVNASLPKLPFRDHEFRLALSSHSLFLYSQQNDLAFHINALEEMLRVALEARVFPLVQLGGLPSPYVEQIVEEFNSRGFHVSIDPVPYEFLRGGDKMLRIHS